MSDTEYTKGYRAGRAYEQERIMKLLENKAIMLQRLRLASAMTDFPIMQDDSAIYFEAIELIKGETNE